MFARMLEFPVRMEKKEEFVTLFNNEVLPILKKQPGFLEIIALFPEIRKEKVVTISLGRTNAMRSAIIATPIRKFTRFLNPICSPPWR